MLKLVPFYVLLVISSTALASGPEFEACKKRAEITEARTALALSQQERVEATAWRAGIQNIGVLSITDLMRRQSDIAGSYSNLLLKVDEFSKGNQSINPSDVCKKTKDTISAGLSGLKDGNVAYLEDFVGIGYESIKATVKELCGSWYSTASQIINNWQRVSAQ